MLELCRHDDSPGASIRATLEAPPDLLAWMREAGSAPEIGLVPAPPAVKSLLAAVHRSPGAGPVWLLPSARKGGVSGGIVFTAETGQDGVETVVNGETAELRSFASTLALALETANR